MTRLTRPSRLAVTDNCRHHPVHFDKRNACVDGSGPPFPDVGGNVVAPIALEPIPRIADKGDNVSRRDMKKLPSCFMVSTL